MKKEKTLNEIRQGIIKENEKQIKVLEGIKERTEKEGYAIGYSIGALKCNNVKLNNEIKYRRNQAQKLVGKK